LERCAWRYGTRYGWCYCRCSYWYNRFKSAWKIREATRRQTIMADNNDNIWSKEATPIHSTIIAVIWWRSKPLRWALRSVTIINMRASAMYCLKILASYSMNVIREVHWISVRTECKYRLDYSCMTCCSISVLYDLIYSTNLIYSTILYLVIVCSCRSLSVIFESL
jgi:hypothetical protein